MSGQGSQLSAGQTVRNNLVAGSLSGCGSMLVCHPLDVLRVRMQADSGVGLTLRRLLIDMVKHEGAISLYRGFLPPFFAQGLYKSTIFCTNSLVSQNVFTGSKTSATTFASGCIAGTVNSLVVAPVELIRTRQIVTPSTSMWACLREVLAEPRGVAGLWRGVVPAAARDGPGVGFYLLVFDQGKRFFARGSGPGAQLEAGAIAAPSSLVVRVASAACAGAAFWVWALPLDGIKTLVEVESMQAPGVGAVKGNRSSADIARAVLASLARRGGLSHLFKAWPVAIGRGLPSAVITLTTYDAAMEWLESEAG